MTSPPPPPAPPQPLPDGPGPTVEQNVGVNYGTVVGIQSNIVVQDGESWYLGVTPPIRIRTLADPHRPDAPPVLVSRADARAELGACWEAVRNDRDGRVHRLAVISGAFDAGKQDLLRVWLAELAQAAPAPMVATTTFLPPYIGAGDQAHFFQNHPVWKLDWTKYGEQVQAHFPRTFTLGGYPWVTLAAQLAGQSQSVRRLLERRTPHQADLQSELPIDNAALRATLSLLVRAAAQDAPLILVLEHVQRADPAWQFLLDQWLSQVQRLPCLVVLTVDNPIPLHDARGTAVKTPWLDWLRLRTAPYSPRAHHLHLGALSANQVGGLLAASSERWAAELFRLTGGAADTLRELLTYWRDIGVAAQDERHRWRLRFDPLSEVPGTLSARLIQAPLQRSVDHLQELGYDASVDQLLVWLQQAVWEGDLFTDEALAYAVGMHGENLEMFQELLDEGLCIQDPDEADGVLVELDEPVAVPTTELERRFRYMARYAFQPPVLAAILRGQQTWTERLASGQRYAQALVQAYAPAVDQIAGRLIEIYEAIGVLDQAAALRERYFPQDADEEELLIWALLPLIVDAGAKRLAVHKIQEYTLRQLHRHPQPLPRILAEGLRLARELSDNGAQAWVLTVSGFVYSDLGDKRQALDYYEQALPLQRQVGDKGGEAATLTGIGAVYSDLGDKRQALEYYEQALPLQRQVGEKGGEAATLTGIGAVYSDLGDNRQALKYLEQALPLRRQVEDNRGEAATLHNIGAVYSALGDKRQALEYLEQALPLLRQVGDKRGEAATLTGIGAVYSDLGDKRQALDYYEQALPLQRQVGDKGGEAATLTGIGAVYSDLGDNRQALEYLEQALPLRRQVEDKGGEAATLHRIATVAIASGDLEQAAELLAAVIDLEESIDHPDLEAHREELAAVRAQLTSRTK